MNNDPIIVGWCVSGISFCLGIIVGIIGRCGTKDKASKDQAKKEELTPDETTKSLIKPQNNGMEIEFERALQTIVDLTEDDDFICERMSMTIAGSEWCRLNCGNRCSPDIVCCKEWISNHWYKNETLP